MLACGLLLLAAGCDEQAVRPSMKPAKAAPPRRAADVDESPPANAADSPRRYDGLTLAEWRRRIKDLDPNDPAAAAAVAGLMEIVADSRAPWHSRRQAALTLGRIGEPAKQTVPLLIGLLVEEEPDSRNDPSLWAARALALFGPLAQEAAPELIRRLNDRSLGAADRMASLNALSQIGTADPGAIPALVGILDSPTEDAGLRRLAAESLGAIGGGAAPAVPVLLRAAGDDDETLKRTAVAALGAIGPQAAVAVPVLTDLLIFDESPAVRDQAADALAGIGPASVVLLTRLLRDRDAEVRWRSARSLGRIRPVQPATLAALTEALRDDDAQVRMHALESLWAVRPQAKPLIPFVLGEFTNEDRQVRMRAYRLLLAMGDDARPAIQPLQKLAEDKRAYVRQTARRALQSLTEDE